MRFLIPLLLLLAGCQQQVPAPLPPPPEVAVAVVPDVPVAPVIPEPPSPHFVMGNILNLAPDTLANILGKPSLKRAEKGVQVWLYKNRECILHLYFYPDDNGDFRLDYVAAEAVDPAADNPTVSPNACLDSHVVSTEDPQPSFPDRGINPQPDRSDN